MRIAIFSEVYWPMVSGVSATLTRTRDALVGRGHEVRVYTGSYDLPHGSARSEVHRSPSQPFQLSPEVQWAAPDPRSIDADLRRFEPDVVHLATEFAMGYAGLRAARRLGLPIVASAHTDYERYADRYQVGWALPLGWLYLRWFYRHAAVVLAPSHEFRDHLRTRGVGALDIWSRGVDSAAFTPAARSEAYRRSLGVGPGDAIVAFVGRLAPEKGIDRLLHAWERIAPRHTHAHLVFTGQGPLESAIRARALPRVHLTGVLRGAALAQAYASADVFAMPSETETFGNVTLEAMASGTPPVAIATGGVLDFARHLENAWLAAPDRPGHFVAGLDRLLADGGLRRRLAGAARLAALARPWGPVFDGLVDHYRTAAESPVPRLAA